MVVLPMAMDDSMVEVEVGFHNMYKEKMKLQAEKNTESNVIIGKYSLNELEDSKYYKDQPIRLTETIRRISSYYNNDVTSIKVISEKYQTSDFCDQYSIPLPPEKSNIYVDTLYGILVNNLRFTNPLKKKDTVLSLKRTGIINSLNEHDQINMLELRQNTTSKSEYFYLLDEQGLNAQAEWISFLETLDFTMIDKSFKSRRSYEQILSTFANTETKLKKDMTNYLQIGEENYLIYSYYYQLINNKQFSKYSLPQKQYIKEKVV